MFFHKVETGDRSALLYGIAGIVAIVFLSVGLLFVLKTFRVEAPVENAVADTPELSDEASAANVLAEYKKSLSELRSVILNAPDDATAISIAEEKVFGMRVPKGMLDVHFQTLLLIRRYKGDTTLLNAKDKLVMAIDELRKQAEKKRK